jgi:hypothetical protein
VSLTLSNLYLWVISFSVLQAQLPIVTLWQCYVRLSLHAEGNTTCDEAAFCRKKSEYLCLHVSIYIHICRYMFATGQDVDTFRSNNKNTLQVLFVKQYLQHFFIQWHVLITETCFLLNRFERRNKKWLIFCVHVFCVSKLTFSYFDRIYIYNIYVPFLYLF